MVKKGKKTKKNPKKLTVKQKQNKTVIWALVLMASVIIIIFLVPYIKNNIINKFEYIGLDFYKTKVEGIVFYSTQIPLINQYGFPIGDYSIYFRNDPIELEDIEVDIYENKIEFQKNLPVYISIESEAPICDDNIIAVVGLTNFLDKFGNLEVKGAMHDAIFALNNELSYVTCDTHSNNTVLLLKTSNETMLKRVNKNCYEIQYKGCEINRASEKFMLTIIKTYMEKYNELDIKG